MQCMRICMKARSCEPFVNTDEYGLWPCTSCFVYHVYFWLQCNINDNCRSTSTSAEAVAREKWNRRLPENWHAGLWTSPTLGQETFEVFNDPTADSLKQHSFPAQKGFVIIFGACHYAVNQICPDRFHLDSHCEGHPTVLTPIFSSGLEALPQKEFIWGSFGLTDQTSSQRHEVYLLHAVSVVGPIGFVGFERMCTVKVRSWCPVQIAVSCHLILVAHTEFWYCATQTRACMLQHILSRWWSYIMSLQRLPPSGGFVCSSECIYREACLRPHTGTYVSTFPASWILAYSGFQALLTKSIMCFKWICVHMWLWCKFWSFNGKAYTSSE